MGDDRALAGVDHRDFVLVLNVDVDSALAVGGAEFERAANRYGADDLRRHRIDDADAAVAGVHHPQALGRRVVNHRVGLLAGGDRRPHLARRAVEDQRRVGRAIGRDDFGASRDCECRMAALGRHQSVSDAARDKIDRHDRVGTRDVKAVVNRIDARRVPAAVSALVLTDHGIDRCGGRDWRGNQPQGNIQRLQHDNSLVKAPAPYPPHVTAGPDNRACNVARGSRDG